MNDPLVSIIIPLYNTEKYIEKAINSVINQTYKNWQLIVIDDCSTDDSLNIVLKIRKQNNFSNEKMRTNGSENLFTSMCEKLGEVHEEGISNYGSDNDQRLTGLHETQKISEFSYGISDRGASIRIPI